MNNKEETMEMDRTQALRRLTAKNNRQVKK